MGKRVTVKDLARELNLSLGTINIALNNKEGISEETRKRVLKAAKEMGYSVNRVAQSMARKTIDIAIIIPDFCEEYFGGLKYGIEQELKALRDYNIVGTYYTVHGISNHTQALEMLHKCKAEDKSAAIICASYDMVKKSQTDELNKLGMPFVFLGDDIEGCKKLCSVRVNAVASGRLAAEFMSYVVSKNQCAAVFVGSKQLEDHRQKYEGFAEGLAATEVKFCGVYETFDEPDIAYSQTKKLILENPELGGIYVATANWKGVCNAIEEQAKAREIRVIATDIDKNTAVYMEKGLITAGFYQNPIIQGRMAVRAIYDKLGLNKNVSPEQLIIPQLILKSNLECVDKIMFQL